LGYAAVDEEIDSGDEATVIGSKEGNDFGDFVGGSPKKGRSMLRPYRCFQYDWEILAHQLFFCGF